MNHTIWSSHGWNIVFFSAGFMLKTGKYQSDTNKHVFTIRLTAVYFSMNLSFQWWCKDNLLKHSVVRILFNIFFSAFARTIYSHFNLCSMECSLCVKINTGNFKSVKINRSMCSKFGWCHRIANNSNNFLFQRQSTESCRSVSILITTVW